MSSQTPFPPSGQYISSIWSSAKTICEKENISINEEAIQRILRSPVLAETWDRHSNFPGFALPLNYASALDELNVLSVNALLYFGSGFDVPLRKQTGYGAANAIKALIFSMYISSNNVEGDLFSAEGMSTIPLAKVAELMGVDVMVERAHPTLVGVTVAEPGGPIKEFVELITKTLNETGKLLKRSGYPSLGLFVTESLKAVNGDADGFLEKIIRAVPAFQDSHIVNGIECYAYSKAVYLLVAVYVRFGSISPPPFPIPRIGDVPAAPTCLQPSLLVHWGVIDLSKSPRLSGLWPSAPEDSMFHILRVPSFEKPDEVSVEEGPAGTLEQAYILRAAGIIAADAVRRVARGMAEKDEGTPPFVKNLLESVGNAPYRIHSWFTGITREHADHKGNTSLVFRDTIYF